MNKIYPRDLYFQIKPYLKSRQAIVVTGIRRSGKTSLLKFIFAKIKSPNKLFLDLENPLNRRLFEEKNYKTIKTNLQAQGINMEKKAYLFLDEIQWQKTIPSVVKYFIDHYQTKFFLTGSASFYLKNLFSESLVGRKYLFELFPLTFKEFLRFKEVKLRFPKLDQEITQTTWEMFKPYSQEYWQYGAFPQVVLADDLQEKKEILSEIFSSYFQKEIEQLSDFRKTDLLRDFIILLAENIGSILNLQRFSSELGVSRLTLEQWLSFLEATYLIALVPPYSKSQRVAIRKAKKVYFIDWALAGQIVSLSSGQRWENCVFHLLRQKGKLSFYQKKSGAEIDFILNNKHGFEAKFKGRQLDVKNLERLASQLKLEKACVISSKFSSAENIFPGFVL